MNFEHSFRIPLPLDRAWPLFLDIERIAPCVPGAQLQEIDGNEYRGAVKVKLGPITAQYKGAVVMEEIDAAAHRMVMNAKARDVHGQGNASAKVVATMIAEGGATLVSLATDLQISGKVASLGKGVMQDVSAKLIQQFADALEKNIAADAPAPATAPLPEHARPIVPEPTAPISSEPLIEAGDGASSEPLVEAGSTGPRKIDAPEAEAVDVLALGREAVGNRIASWPIIGPIIRAISRLFGGGR